MKEYIKYVREASKLTQEEFAALLGTTSVTISRWENGRALPNKIIQKLLFDFCEKNGINVQELIIKKYKASSSEDRIILYHGSRGGIVGEIAPISREKCDFGKGFYMGTDPLQPLTLICAAENPVMYTLELDVSDVNIVDCEEDMEWAMVIAYHRRAMEAFKHTAIYEKYAAFAENCDIITGHIADDKMYDVLQGFFRGEITDKALIKCLSVLELGRQYVAITPKACSSVKIIKKQEVQYFEQLCLQKISKMRRQEAVELTAKTKKDYRREGRFLDEILEAGEL